MDDQILVSMYEQANEEARRYRDLEWQVTTWTVGLLAGAVAASHLKVPASSLRLAQVVLALFVALTAGGAFVHLRFLRGQLSWNRKVMRAFESTLTPSDPRFQHAIDTVRTKAGSKLPALHWWTWWIVILAAAFYSEYAVILMAAS
jgi:hypothetical protein